MTLLVVAEERKDSTDAFLAVFAVEGVVDAPVPSHWVVVQMCTFRTTASR